MKSKITVTVLDEAAKLNPKREQIERYLGMGLGVRPIAKLIDEAPSTLRDFVKRRDVLRK